MKKKDGDIEVHDYRAFSIMLNHHILIVPSYAYLVIVLFNTFKKTLSRVICKKNFEITEEIAESMASTVLEVTFFDSYLEKAPFFGSPEAFFKLLQEKPVFAQYLPNIFETFLSLSSESLFRISLYEDEHLEIFENERALQLKYEISQLYNEDFQRFFESLLL